MSTHTTHFCDYCNQDRETTYGTDEGHAVNYSEVPTLDGWAEFEKPYTDSLGYKRSASYHICAHCLADPEFEPSRWGAIPEWDAESRNNLAKGRAHADAFARAQESLGTPDRWGYRGVRQIFGNFGYGYRVGPKMQDGRFSPSDRPIAKVAA